MTLRKLIIFFRLIQFNLYTETTSIIGKKAEVVLNPETGGIVSVNPTSTKKAEKLINELPNVNRN
ncbi:MAG: hypothetical protein WDZ28_00095 [Simkaniaceae bacterium]